MVRLDEEWEKHKAGKEETKILQEIMSEKIPQEYWEEKRREMNAKAGDKNRVYTTEDINWDETIDNFTQAKFKTEKRIFENQEVLFLVGSTKDTIIGRPQLNGNSMNKIVLLRRVQKIVKDKEGEEQYITTLKFMNDKFDARYDGKEIDSYALNFWTYIVEGTDHKVYTLLCKDKLPNEVCVFTGMKMEMNDQVEVSKTLKINKLTDIFFVKSFESNVKTLSKEDLVNLTKEKKINLTSWRDFLGFHPLGTINRYPEETENLRSIIVLSGRKDGYPLSTLLMGRAGTKKSAFLETLGYKLDPSPSICDGAITTLKGLTPSFVSKPANPGFLCSSNRLALVDELGKMIEKELNRHEQQTGNLLGDFNSLIEQKKRIVSSGNDNSTEIQMTAKSIFTTNPVGKKATIHEHIGVIDSTFLSRNLIWVQDREETEFVMSDEAIVSPQGCPSIYPSMTNDKNDTYCIPFGGNCLDRNTFLTIFDSCLAFNCSIDSQKVKELVTATINIASEPMKSEVWKPRALHHVYLIVDGLCKQRCLFEDYDPSFETKDIDYAKATQFLLRMINSWDVYLK